MFPEYEKRIDKKMINFLIELNEEQAVVRGLSNPEEIEAYDEASATKPILEDIKLPIGKILSMLIKYTGNKENHNP
ncbi:MAG: hypothetical protein WC908_00375 [Candidatus Paceibacterota bacterium]